MVAIFFFSFNFIVAKFNSWISIIGYPYTLAFPMAISSPRKFITFSFIYIKGRLYLLIPRSRKYFVDFPNPFIAKSLVNSIYWGYALLQALHTNLFLFFFSWCIHYMRQAKCINLLLPEQLHTLINKFEILLDELYYPS